ncbi:acetolactate decarboxylase [Flagellimonas okinawensis]|uniref:Alpha-acetolactate decarboxylase n=1 Tax=Flagellimonas okinawensis TaxID=3031324 RepID=A0ABT5XR40_9FLAO|nr:acetolactate decarboxylase [[Muricauda] okinawensis]MDF0708354.1 acetolactate decarboxylase [[Muricauda] okinawensis]
MTLKNLSLAFLSIVFFSQLHAQSSKVRPIGAMKDMGNTYDIHIWLDTLSNKKHLYGMGPYDKMKGEITVVDGHPYYASAFTEGAYQVGESWDIKSPFFVYGSVDQWKMFKIEGVFNSVGDIQQKVEQIAQEYGLDSNQAFPFRVTGNFDDLTAHIVTPRLPEVDGYREGVKSQKFSFKDTKGELIGFYSKNHQGIFTHTDSFVHIHFLMKDKTFMGHLDQITTAQKTFKLYLPKR